MSISVLISVPHTPAGLIRVVPNIVRVIVIDCISEGTDSRNWQLQMPGGDEDGYKKMRQKSADKFWTLKFLHKDFGFEL
jgi:hypothetical protein